MNYGASWDRSTTATTIATRAVPTSPALSEERRRTPRLRPLIDRTGQFVRSHARFLLWTLGGLFAAYLLVPQAGGLAQAVEALGAVSWSWMAFAALIATMIFPMAALAQMGATDRSLSFRRTTAVQLAASFVAQLTPQGLGGAGVNERYLERAGVARAAAIGAVTLNMAAGAVVHVILLTIVGLIVGGVGIGEMQLPSVHWVLFALLSIGTVLAVVLGSSWGRRRLVAPAWSVARSMAGVLRSPARAAQLFGGSAGVTASYALTLAVTVQAFGTDAPVLGLIAVYLGGAAVGSLIPTPGGLGAIEAALVAGVTALGVALGPAVAAVSVFRLLTFWLPMAPGFVAFHYLQRRQVL